MVGSYQNPRSDIQFSTCVLSHFSTKIQVWNLANCKLKTNHIGHTGYLNTVTVSPDGSLCASGGKVLRLDKALWGIGLSHIH